MRYDRGRTHTTSHRSFGLLSADKHLAAAVRVGRILSAAVAAVATAIFAYVEMFSQFQYYDDEGYLMVSVKSFLDGHPLFDETFSPYGPLHFLFAKLLHGVTGLPVSHDVNRLVTICLWLAAAGITALLVYRLTASFAWALVAYLQTVLLSHGMVNEPGHPQALLVALIALLPLIGAMTPTRKSGTVLLGVITACVCLSKINLGIYTAAAVLIAHFAMTTPTLLMRAGFFALSAAATALPFVLMRGADWADNYARISALSMAASCVAMWRPDVRDHLPPSRIGVYALSAAAGGALILLVTLLTGTSLEGLIDGVFLAPLRFPNVFSIPWRLPEFGVVLGAVSLFTALAASFLPLTMRARSAVLLKGVFAILVAVTIYLGGTARISVAPLVWVILLPSRPEPWRIEALFPRALLCLLAASHLLVAYPVAGSQQDWATLLLVPAAIVGMADAMAAFTARPSLPVRRIAELACLALILVVHYPRLSSEPLLDRYRALVPLQLPGASRIRLRDEQVQLYRDVAATIERHCDAFVSMPGFNSFYFWTRQEPPTAQNATTWMTLFDDRMQQRIVDSLAAHRAPCVIYNQPVAEEWVGGRAIDRGPLVRYIRSSFHTFRTIGDFQLMDRNNQP